MSLLEATCARIREPDTRIAVEMQRRLDDKTKPRGSLGRLEELACQIAAIRGSLDAEPPRKAVVVMGATVEGKKELVALTDGFRESEQSWKDVLLDMRRRGLKHDPQLLP